LHLWVVPLAGQISSTLWSAKRNCYETNLDIANHGMGIQDRWLQFKLSQEWHQWLNIRHPILLCQLYHTHPTARNQPPTPILQCTKNFWHDPVQAQGLSKLNTNNNPTTKFVTMNKPGI
jgi:hypothetical protein